MEAQNARSREVPERSKQRDIIRDLENANRPTAKQSAQLIFAPWFKDWKLVVGYPDGFQPSRDAAPLSPIDNLSIWSSIRSQERLYLHDDYEILSTASWNHLINWYGGGPGLRVLLKDSEGGEVDVDFELVPFRAIYREQTKQLSCYKFSTLEMLTAQMKSAFDIPDSTETRIIDWFNGFFTRVLEESTVVDGLPIRPGQDMRIDVKDSSGEWIARPNAWMNGLSEFMNDLPI
jgi:hypothetical protein